MEKADISITLHGAASIATDITQVVLMDESLLHIIPNIIALNGVLFFNLVYYPQWC